MRVGTGVLFAILLVRVGIPDRAWAEVEAEADYPDYVEEMQGVRVDINGASMAELLRLPGVGPAIGSRIVESRKGAGPFTTTRDLVTRGILTKEAFAAVAPYLTVRKKGPAREDRIAARVRIADRWLAGGPSPLTPGSYFRWRWERSGRWTAGILAQRDPGESSPFDNLKWGISYRNGEGRLRALCLGDLRYELSRGLLFFTRSRVGRGYEVVGAASRTGRGLGVDLSSSEGYGLRGLGVGWRPAAPLTLTAVVSSSRLDAARDDSGRVTAIRTTGYHPPSSSTDRDGVSLLTLIAHLELALGERLMVGVTAARLGYSETIAPPLVEDSVLEFRGSRRWFTGLDWDAALPGFGVFGEVGWEHGRGGGLVAGLENGVGPARWNLLFRDYAPDFSPPFGNPFQDGRGSPSNEMGLYSGLEWRIAPPVGLAIYIDSYRRAWRRGREAFPGAEREMFLEGRWRVGARTHTTLRFLERWGDRVESEGDLSKDRWVVTRKVRLQVDWEDRPMAFRGRYETTVAGGEDAGEDSGSLLYFDTRYRPAKRFSIDLRVTLFASRSAYATVYAHESDLPGVMNVASYAGDGMRWYLYGRLRLRKGMTISVKFDETYRSMPGEKGDGTAEKAGRLGVQIDYRN